MARAMAGVCYWFLVSAGRSAYDPDKETPPAWWCEVVDGGPGKPPMTCASCGFPVGDAETVIIRDGKVIHVACARHRRRTIRPDGVGPC